MSTTSSERNPYRPYPRNNFYPQAPEWVLGQPHDSVVAARRRLRHSMAPPRNNDYSPNSNSNSNRSRSPIRRSDEYDRRLPLSYRQRSRGRRLERSMQQERDTSFNDYPRRDRRVGFTRYNNDNYPSPRPRSRSRRRYDDSESDSDSDRSASSRSPSPRTPSSADIRNHIEVARHKKNRHRVYTGLACVSTAATLNGIYQSTKLYQMRKQELQKKQIEGVEALRAGERGEGGKAASAKGEKQVQQEMQKAGRKKLAMDVLALGVAAVGMYNVRLGWQRVENVKKGKY